MVAGLRTSPASPPSLVGYCSALCESGSDLLGTAPSNMPRRRTPPRLSAFFLDFLLEVAQVPVSYTHLMLPTILLV